ncbi:hypothetical protein OG579_03830 [Williamsia herbipolensis]|uniref:DUF2591 domain-containing protein n=1 Tax=Williamsia herbipolensis TaxID=1603258 RepID=A0AAU4K4D1_9NOCA|nr:hypothetical protein [Williamsia herbipolensis]
MTRSFSVDELLDTIGEAITLLRDPRGHQGTFRPYLCDTADFEFVSLWRSCLLVGVDPVGIPCWSPGGVVRGLSSRTTAQHITWMVCDVADRLPFDDSEIHRMLWTARSRSIGASNEVASLMLAVREAAIDDEFDQFRAEDTLAARSA